MSFCATSGLLSYLAYVEFRASRGQNAYSVHTQGFFWLVNLFIAGFFSNGHASDFLDFIQSFAGLLLANSLRLNSTLPGPFCSFQGLLLNSGDISSAIWSLVIAWHTFLTLAGGHKLRHWVAEKSAGGALRWIICLSIWLSVLFIGVVGIALIEKVQPERGPFCNFFRLKVSN